MPVTIHKFELKPIGLNIVQLPTHCSILSVAEKDGALMMWVRLDPDRPKAPYDIAVVGTGWEAPTDDVESQVYWQFIDTVVMSSGLVWHVFVRIDFNEDAEITRSGPRKEMGE